MPLIILDRDGVINYDSSEYIKSPEEWIPIPGSLKAIAKLNRAGYHVVVATNQSGLARGLFDLAMLEKIHAKFSSALKIEGGVIADIFFCSHHPENNCTCRKPQPGMLLQLCKKYSVDAEKVYFVGDSISDLQAAKNAGCKPLLVLTGNGHKTLAYAETLNSPYFCDLAQAAEFVINEKKYDLKTEAKDGNLDSLQGNDKNLSFKNSSIFSVSNGIAKVSILSGMPITTKVPTPK